MYRIGELVKVAEVTPDTIRYYEKRQMMRYEVRIEGGFRLYTGSNPQRLKFTRHAGQLGLSLESIRELLSTRIDPEHHTCRESKSIVQGGSQEVEARITELQSVQRSLQRLNDICYGTAHSSAHRSILEAPGQGASGVKSGCWFFVLAGPHSRR